LRPETREKVLITIQQIKAARGLLEWNQEELANHAGLHVDQVRRFEVGKSKTLEILEAIYKAFTIQGIEFIEEGVRKRKYEIRVLQGQQGFWDFYDDIYETIRKQGGDIFVHNVDETLFTKWLGEKRFSHRERMHKLTNFEQKIIIREGDMNFAVNYASTQYRWASANEFSPTPFYLYGERLAMVMFEDDNVSVFILDQPKITESYKILFMAAWERAKVPPKAGA
jgi:transcriptional regulator with XRE-family HTH domain